MFEGPILYVYEEEPLIWWTFHSVMCVFTLPTHSKIWILRVYSGSPMATLARTLCTHTTDVPYRKWKMQIWVLLFPLGLRIQQTHWLPFCNHQGRWGVSTLFALVQLLWLFEQVEFVSAVGQWKRERGEQWKQKVQREEAAQENRTLRRAHREKSHFSPPVQVATILWNGLCAVIGKNDDEWKTKLLPLINDMVNGRQWKPARNSAVVAFGITDILPINLVYCLPAWSAMLILYQGMQ